MSRLGLLALALAAGCGAARPLPCRDFASPEVRGALEDPRLAEISGAAASRAQPGVIFVHNDSGEPHARFFAIDAEGRLLAEYALGEEPAVDLEEIALGPSRAGGGDAVYLADIGDNDARLGRGARTEIVVFRVEEPRLAAGSSAGGALRETLSPVERFVLRYPDAPVDAEAFFVERERGDLYLLGKVAEGPAPVFVARAPLSETEPNVLEEVGTTIVAADLGDSITGASLDASGLRLAVRTYRHVLLFVRAPDEPWLEVLARPPLTLPRVREPQGESVTFVDADGSLLTISEGERAPLHVLRPRCGAR